MLGVSRAFFAERGVLEVDCPFLARTAPVDPYIDIFEVLLGEGETGYLHSSPEYGMKRLLVRGIGPIYQLSHVYRKGERGKRHQPEFTMVEWYRPDSSFGTFVEEIVAYLSLFFGALPYEMTTYKQAFMRYAEIDPFRASRDLLEERLRHFRVETDVSEREALEGLLWGCAVEPRLGREGLMIVTDYPEEQAALAKTYVNEEGDKVAERFEVYLNGTELGNGYHELTDPAEQERRLRVANEKRRLIGKGVLPIDTLFLEALREGMPDAYGIAVGFDRLMMLRRGVDEIASVIPIAF